MPDVAEDSAELFTAIAGASRTVGHVCAPSLQQKVIAQCVDVRPNLEAYDRNRTTLYDALTSYGYRCIKPDGAFYLFVEAPNGSSKDFPTAPRRTTCWSCPETISAAPNSSV